jgi:hypothetical protein
MGSIDSASKLFYSARCVMRPSRPEADLDARGKAHRLSRVMKNLVCSLGIVFSFVVSVQVCPAAPVDMLAAAIETYSQSVDQKLNSDLETIARAFSDAREIQKARTLADAFKLRCWACGWSGPLRG